MTFNVFMTVEWLCSLLLSHYIKNVGGGEGEVAPEEDCGVDVKATEQMKIRYCFSTSIDVCLVFVSV